MTTKYTVFGDKVSFETTGSDKIHYSYDASGNLFSMNLNGSGYYYTRNAQGDITGLIDGAKSQVVSYTYDTWGKLISTTGSLAGTLGVKNPYRYRGYRYDTETGLYYLQSRYYNPDWGRFVNGDGLGVLLVEQDSLIQNNIFVYCLNNSVNKSDSTGYVSIAQQINKFGPILFNTLLAYNLVGKALLTKAIMLLFATAPYLAVIVATVAIGVIAYYNVQKISINNIKENIPSKIKTKDGRVNLSKFTNPNGPLQPRGGRSILGPMGYQIVKDLDQHKGSIWKLLDSTGRRIASLAADGRVVGK